MVGVVVGSFLSSSPLFAHHAMRACTPAQAPCIENCLSEGIVAVAQWAYSGAEVGVGVGTAAGVNTPPRTNAAAVSVSDDATPG